MLWVVLLAEDVDRNATGTYSYTLAPTSSSSRRTWIEIIASEENCWARDVVLLAEDVDRNVPVQGAHDMYHASSSSRRTWIEIFSSSVFTSPPSVVLLAEDVDRNYRDAAAVGAKRVVLLAEDVDRNIAEVIQPQIEAGRPPRGGRG